MFCSVLLVEISYISFKDKRWNLVDTLKDHFLCLSASGKKPEIVDQLCFRSAKDLQIGPFLENCANQNRKIECAQAVECKP